MKEKVIYKIEPIEIFNLLLRLTSIVAIILMAINFKVNPLAFSIFSLFALLVFAMTSTSHLFIYENRFVIEHRSVFKFLNKKCTYKFEEIESVEYSKGFFNPLNLISYTYGTNKEKEYVINYKNGKEEEYIRIIGSKSNAIQAMQIMNKLINNQIR